MIDPSGFTHVIHRDKRRNRRPHVTAIVGIRAVQMAVCTPCRGRERPVPGIVAVRHETIDRPECSDIVSGIPVTVIA